MASSSGDAFREESREVVDEFLRRGLLEPELARHVEGLLADDRPVDALEIILDRRQERSTDAARVDSVGSDDAT